MKKYSKEELIEIVNRINKIQRFIFKFKKNNRREPTNEDIANILEEPIEKILEVKEILEEIERQDNELEHVLGLKTNKHTKEDIIKAREIRKAKKEIRDIQKYMKDE